jgi:hypothetical protein
MTSFVRSVALSAITLYISVTAAAAQTQCGALDQAVTDKLKPLIDRSDARSTALAGAVMKDLGWARLDCREGRLVRAEAEYRQILTALQAAPSEAQGSPAWDFAAKR